MIFSVFLMDFQSRIFPLPLKMYIKHTHTHTHTKKKEKRKKKERRWRSDFVCNEVDVPGRGCGALATSLWGGAAGNSPLLFPLFELFDAFFSWDEKHGKQFISCTNLMNYDHSNPRIISHFYNSPKSYILNKIQKFRNFLSISLRLQSMH